MNFLIENTTKLIFYYQKDEDSNQPIIFVTEGGEKELEPDKLIKLVLSGEEPCKTVQRNNDTCSLVEMIEWMHLEECI